MMYRAREESEEGIRLSGGVCVICGWNKKSPKGGSLLHGAHVRPFSNIPDYDKADNIIGLCPNHHVEYDAGSLTIDPVGGLCIHSNSEDTFHLKKIIGGIGHIKLGYFDYHKKHVFRPKKQPL